MANGRCIPLRIELDDSHHFCRFFRDSIDAEAVRVDYSPYFDYIYHSSIEPEQSIAKISEEFAFVLEKLNSKKKKLLHNSIVEIFHDFLYLHRYSLPSKFARITSYIRFF